MAKLSDLIRQIDSEAKAGNRAKALRMLDKLLEKVPDHKPLLARKERYAMENDFDLRISALEQKYGVARAE